MITPLPSFTLTFTNPQVPVVPEPIQHTRKLQSEEKQVNKTVKATRKYLRTSIKKVWGMVKVLKGVHVEDAITALEANRQKPAAWVKNIVKAGIRNAIGIKGMHEDRLYVKYFVLGKNTGIKGIRRHAKSKSGRMLRPKIQITVVIEEKTVEDLYRIIMDGKFSPTIASFLRYMLLHSNSAYEEIVKYQNYLTAKGRQQQKLMFKRKIESFLLEQEKIGVKLDKTYAKELVLREESKAFVGNYWETKKIEVDKKISERLEIFNRNQKSR